MVRVMVSLWAIVRIINPNHNPDAKIGLRLRRPVSVRLFLLVKNDHVILLNFS